MSEARSGKGYGKLLLFGEHSAIYGYPALGLSLEITTELHASSAIPPEGKDVPPLALTALNRALTEIRAAYAAEGLPAHNPGTSFSYTSSVPMGSGLGSSAAACVALARICAPRGIPESFIWQAANRGEAVFHGRPSGIDTGLALGGGICAFTFGGAELPERRRIVAPRLALLAGYLPRETSTRALIDRLAELKRERPHWVEKRLVRLGDLTQAAIGLMAGTAKQDLPESLGALTNQAHALLTELGLSTEHTERVVDICRTEGAWGAKLSGAGGGGAFFAICPDLKTARSIRHRLETLSYCRTLEPFDPSSASEPSEPAIQPPQPTAMERIP